MRTRLWRHGGRVSRIAREEGMRWKVAEKNLERWAQQEMRVLPEGCRKVHRSLK